MVYCTCLENRSVSRHREFESHPLRMSMHMGTVLRGKRHGSALGYPTANVPLMSDESGIYAARVEVNAGQMYLAAAFADQSRKILEVHILDFAEDIYGLPIRIELLKKFREASSFENETLLKKAIEADIAEIREYFAH